MRKFLVFFKKEFLHIFRDYRSLIILFGIPIAQIIIFGYAVSTDIKNASIAVYDQCGSTTSREISARLDASDFFTVTKMVNSIEEIEEEFLKGRIKEALIIEPGFEEKLLRGEQGGLMIIADGSEPNTASLVAAYTNAIISAWQAEKKSGFTQGVIVPEVRMFYNPEMKSHFMFVPGVITLILILICALMTSVTITREKEFGTMEVLLVSPLRPIHIIAGKVAPYFLLSLVNLGLILLISWLVFGLPVKGSLLLLLVECMLYILMSLSLGILISTVANNMQSAIFMSLIGLLLPSLLLSGFIFPIENMPVAYHYISLILPPRWFIIIIKDIMIKGEGLAMVWQETLILVIMTIFFIGVSAKKFKNRLE